MFDPEEFRVIFASPEHADAWRFTVITQQQALDLHRSIRLRFIIHSVTTGKAIFLSFTFYSSTFFVARCIRRHLCRFLLRFLLCSSPPIIKRKHSISLPSTFYHRHVLETLKRVMCVYLCLLLRVGKLLSHSTQPPWKYRRIPFTGGDFCASFFRFMYRMEWLAHVEWAEKDSSNSAINNKWFVSVCTQNTTQHQPPHDEAKDLWGFYYERWWRT